LIAACLKICSCNLTFFLSPLTRIIFKTYCEYRGADKSLARPGRKQARKHVRDARDFNNIETRDRIKFFFLQGKTRKEIHAVLTGTLPCFFLGRAKDLSAPLYRRNACPNIRSDDLTSDVKCFVASLKQFYASRG